MAIRGLDDYITGHYGEDQFKNRQRRKKVDVGEVIRPNGIHETVHPHNGKKFTLEELQAFVGGYIERVQLKAGHGHATMYANEDGKGKDLPYNAHASAMAALFEGDYVCGTVIVVRKKYVN
jgi:hypothetical protein